METLPATAAAVQPPQPEQSMPRYRPSPSELAVLRQLSTRPMTVSELGRGLGIDKAAAFRHLNGLLKDGVVERHPSNRKWVYYALTDAGRDSLRAVDAIGPKGPSRKA